VITEWGRGVDKRYRILDKQTVYDGFFQMEQYRLQHTQFEGGWCDPLSRELFERGHAVAALLYDPKEDAVVLVEQFRIGALNHPNHPWFVEIVAGMVEEGESEEEVARRESEEEAGCRVGRMEFIARYWVSPGGTSETIALYCAEVDATRAGGVHGLAQEGEDILVHVVPYGELVERWQQGEINSATPLLAVQWLVMNRARLRKEWR
jgi:ADP-ribose pyrophosphatase